MKHPLSIDILDWIENDLSDPQWVQEIDEHLRGCRACRQAAVNIANSAEAPIDPARLAMINYDPTYAKIGEPIDLTKEI